VQDAPEYLTSDRNAAEMSAAWTMIDPWFALGLSGCCKRPGSPQVRLIPTDAADFTLNCISGQSQKAYGSPTDRYESHGWLPLSAGTDPSCGQLGQAATRQAREGGGNPTFAYGCS
jgi:hypothetical protein